MLAVGVAGFALTVTAALPLEVPEQFASVTAVTV